jgi:hypothetical protein
MRQVGFGLHADGQTDELGFREGTQVETTTSVTFDDVSNSAFALPDPIKALGAKKGQN